MLGASASQPVVIERWTEQGTGEILDDLREIGMENPELYVDIARTGGLAYALIEQVALKGLGRMFKPLNKLTAPLKKAALKKVVEKIDKNLVGRVSKAVVTEGGKLIAEGAGQVAEETLQAGVTKGTAQGIKGMTGQETDWGSVGDAMIKEAKATAEPFALLTGAAGAKKLAGGTYRLSAQAVDAHRERKAQNAEYVSAAIEGKEIRDVETGEVFTPKAWASASKIKSDVRGWLRKHGNVEVVAPALEEDLDTESLDNDGTMPEWNSVETPPETQGNTSTIASESEVEDFVDPTEENATASTQDAENEAIDEQAIPEGGFEETESGKEPVVGEGSDRGGAGRGAVREGVEGEAGGKGKEPADMERVKQEYEAARP
ncbi:hypothetical protein R80B4_02356 [Fibrobacteres bacterium R8-0-B4]